MMRPVALIVVAAVIWVALAVAVSERRVQAAFDALRQEDDISAAAGSTRVRAQRHVQAAEREATATVQLAIVLSALVTLTLGLALSLRLVLQATRLAAAAERIARGNLDAAVPPAPGALGQLAPAVRRAAAALARRERETEALVALAALPSTLADDDAISLHGELHGDRQGEPALERLLEAVRGIVREVLDVRALTLVAVDGERVQRLGTSQRERQGAHYARAGSAVAAMLARGDAVVFDVDRGVHPEDAAARAAGARAYAVVPLDGGAAAPGALVVDLGLCAVAVAELRFLGLVAHELSARLAARPAAGATRLAADRRSARSS